MTLHPSGEGKQGHPYRFGRIIGIFHVLVYQDGPLPVPQRLEFSFVRWFQQDPSTPFSWKKRRLPRLEFVPCDHANAFGFLDPAEIIRGAHLIPAFAHGKTDRPSPWNEVESDTPRAR